MGITFNIADHNMMRAFQVDEAINASLSQPDSLLISSNTIQSSNLFVIIGVIVAIYIK